MNLMNPHPRSLARGARRRWKRLLLTSWTLASVVATVSCGTDRATPAALGSPSRAPAPAHTARETPSAAPPVAATVPVPGTRPARGAGRLRLLWRKTNGDFEAVVDHDAAARLTDAERAAVGYLAAQINADCRWSTHPEVGADGSVTEGDLECELTRALDLGYQCGDEHREFVTGWLAEYAPSRCSKVPATAYVQSALDEVAVDTRGNVVVVKYTAVKTEGPGAKTWKWSEAIEFERIGATRLKLANSKITSGRAPWQTARPKH
ncbi:MAG: hypothetical protein R3B13_20920 [Polyangiaceae bacterium]